MRFHELIENTSGAVAAVAMPMGSMQRRVSKKKLGEDMQADDGVPYRNIDDFLSQFEADWFDEEKWSDDGMELRGYIDGINIMVWRYNSPKKTSGYGKYDDGALEEGHLNNPGEEPSPVVSAVTRRILMQRTDLLAKYGPDKVGQAIDDVADFVGDVEEIGSSDVSAWVKQVERSLHDHHGVEESNIGTGDFNKKDDLRSLFRKLQADGRERDVRRFINWAIDSGQNNMKDAIDLGAQADWDEIDREHSYPGAYEGWERAIEVTGYQPGGSMGEAAPFPVRMAAGLGMGALSGMGGNILGAVLGPIGSAAVGGYAGWHGAKLGMNAADSIWDWAAEKLGGKDATEEFVTNHIRAAAQGKDKFVANGHPYTTKLTPAQVDDAIAAVKKSLQSQ